MHIPWLDPLLKASDRLLATIELAERWRAASQAERDAVVAGWDWGVKWSYPPIGRMACIMGETGTPLERIRAALLLNWLESHEEVREQLIFLCEAYHSCALAGLDPDQVFQEVAGTLPPNAGEFLLRFSRRSDADKALEAFGFVARRDGNGEMEVAFA